MENLTLNFQGVIIGACSFLIIGLFHPLVIKGEYYYGQRVKKWFFIGGVITMIASLLLDSFLASGILAVVAFSCFWSIKEIADQKRRVERGWFPMNPKRRDEYPMDCAGAAEMKSKENEDKKSEVCSFHNGQTSLTNISITEET